MHVIKYGTEPLPSTEEEEMILLAYGKTFSHFIRSAIHHELSLVEIKAHRFAQLAF